MGNADKDCVSSRERGARKIKDVDLELIYRALDFDGVPETSEQPEVIASEETLEDFDEPEIEIDNAATGVSVFNFESNNVRTVVDDNDVVWFVAKDVASALGYVRHRDAISDHCKGAVNRRPLQTTGGLQEVRVINEPDVLRLIMKSKLPSAQKFEKWVFEEVLPTIRRTGKYEIPKEEPVLQINLKDAAIVANDAKILAQAIGITV